MSAALQGNRNLLVGSIDWDSTEPIRVSDLVRLLPPKRDGSRVSPGAIASWQRKAHYGAQLAVVRIKGGVFVRPITLRAFIARRAEIGHPVL